MNADLLDTENDPIDPNDRFPYGWRYVPSGEVYGPEDGEFAGRPILKQVPLTLEDIIHPQEDDYRVTTEGHDTDLAYLKFASRLLLAGRPDALVLSDCRVSWDPTGELGYGPDNCVISGVRRHGIDWATFNVVNEGAEVRQIIEVTSPTTRETDLKNKVILYHDHAVPVYIIADPRHRKGRRVRVRLLGYRYEPDGYVPMELNEQGRLWLDAVQAWLGVDDNRLMLYKPDGEPIEDFVEQVRNREVAEERTALERQAHRNTRQRERRARQRAEAERVRAEAERVRAEAAEAQVRELQEQLRRLAGG